MDFFCYISRACFQSAFLSRFGARPKSALQTASVLVSLKPIKELFNTPRPSRGTRIESCDFIVLIGDP